ncbi:MAG TPA: Crp/Fnr family transcriptional regulator [Jatrophihabitans sp.]|nr:Crp/Fnr family transcriptional regulator [Jatrophihabitans sp.]
MRQHLDVLGGLARSYLFEDLIREQLAPLAAVATTRSLARGEYLWRVGAPAHEIYVVHSGEVKDSVLDPDGVEIIHFVHGPGMTFGEPGFFAVDHQRVVEVSALVPTVLIRLDRRDFTQFMARYPSIKDRVLERLASNTRFQTTLLASVFRRSLADRVGLRLLELVDTNTERVNGAPVTPKISQTTLAAMVGVSRENVNRALASLTADGLVRLDRGRYVLADEAALRERIARDWPIAQRRDRRLV